MYKTKQNYLRFKNHEIFSDKFKEYPKEQQATYWYQIWYLLNLCEGCLIDWDFDSHEVAKKSLDKWLKLWPFEINKTLGGAPAFQKVPTLIDGTVYICETLNFNHIYTQNHYEPLNRFTIQVAYGVLVDLFKDVLDVEQEQVDAFLNPLKDYDKRKFAVIRLKVIKAIVGMSDFFMKTKDVWIETKEFGDWREMDSKRMIEEFKSGFVDHKTPEDYPLDKNKIIDTRKTIDDNRWVREKPFLDEEEIHNGQREKI